jgi:hypothetical protein
MTMVARGAFLTSPPAARCYARRDSVGLRFHIDAEGSNHVTNK